MDAFASSKTFYLWICFQSCIEVLCAVCPPGVCLSSCLAAAAMARRLQPGHPATQPPSPGARAPGAAQHLWAWAPKVLGAPGVWGGRVGGREGVWRWEEASEGPREPPPTSLLNLAHNHLPLDALTSHLEEFISYRTAAVAWSKKCNFKTFSF